MAPFGDFLRGFGKRAKPRAAGVNVDNLLTADLRPEYDRISANVTDHGWACVYVEEPDYGGFGYTVGLSGKGLPELLFHVEDGHVGIAMLNAIAKRLLEHGPNVPDGFEPFPEVRLRNIYAAEFFETCVLAGIWALEHDTMPGAGGMQVILADKDGSFPAD